LKAKEESFRGENWPNSEGKERKEGEEGKEGIHLTHLNVEFPYLN